MSDRRLSPKLFIWPAKLIARRAMTFKGIEIVGGDLIPLDEKEDHRLGMKLWMSGRAVYEADFNPTPISSAPISPTFEMEDRGNGSFAISVPWEDEPIMVKGKKKAIARRDELMAAGEPLSHHGVAIVGDGKGGWYGVQADWIEQEIKVQGMENATFVATNLREAGAPADGSDGIGKVLVDQDRFAVYAPWLDEILFVDGIAHADHEIEQLRAAGKPSDDDLSEQAILDALEGNAPSGDDLGQPDAAIDPDADAADDADADQADDDQADLGDDAKEG